MTVNTHALVPAAPKSAASADGGNSQGQTSAKEAADAFQSVLHGMKRGDEPAEGPGKDGRQQSGGQHTQEQADKGEASAAVTGKAAGDAGKSTAAVTFSTSNLVDALRQVSHNVLSQGAATEEGMGETGQSAAGGEGDLGPVLTGAATAIPANAMLVAQKGRAPQSPGQGSTHLPGQPQATIPVATQQVPDSLGKTGTSSLFAQFGVEPETVTDPLTAGAGRRSILPEEAAGSVKILRQETHFAPNMRLSPAQQVGDQIASALKTLSTEAASGQAGLTHRAEGPVLKTLDIQLTPHELGTVKVSLRMVGDTVEVSLRTSNPQTAELLKQDRQLLDQMLRATGFKADTITIQAADDRASVQVGASTGSNAANGQTTSGNGAFAEGQAQNSNRDSSGQQQGRPGQQQADAGPGAEQPKGKAHEDDLGNSLSDGLYL